MEDADGEKGDVGGMGVGVGDGVHGGAKGEKKEWTTNGV
jgi:hypothetical protein